MASVLFNLSIPTNDPWELLHLAGGDPTISTYDSITATLSNTSVTQLVLDQALVDFTAGIKSTQKQAVEKEAVEEAVSNTDLALAMLGDPLAIASLQAMVTLTASAAALALPAIPPTSGGGGGTAAPLNKFVGTAALIPAPTLFASVPFIDSVAVLPVNTVNTAGVITVAVAGVYSVTCVVDFTTLIKYELQNIRLMVNGIQSGTTQSHEAGKLVFVGSLVIHKALLLAAGDTLAIQYSGTVGALYNAELEILEVR